MAEGSGVPGDARRIAGLERLGLLARSLLTEPSLEELLQRVADEARSLVDGAFSIVLLVGDRTETEVRNFAYNAPRERFPARLPRIVGLLALPLRTGETARVDDARAHPDAVGMPGGHAPLGPLLAAPLKTGSQVLGEVAVAKEPDRPPFDEVDERLFNDFAAHVAAAVSVASAQEARARADELRAAMRDVALHNLRTPLSVAEGSVELLREHGASLRTDERERLYASIATAHRRIRELAEGALADSDTWPIAGGRRPAGTIELGVLVDQLLGDLRDAGPVRLVGVIDADAPSSFRGDHRSIREALENLLTNAIKASPRNGTVTLTARREQDTIRFDVTDEGAGIPPEQQARMFETAPGAVAAGSGGRGLLLVRRLVEGHGGTVGLTSRPGSGSTFWVTFPLGL